MSTNFDKYFCDKQCCYWREYEQAYKLDFNGKTVVMVGADCLSSALYFVINGAKKVITYEKEKRLLDLSLQVCKEFNFCDKVEINGEWNGQYPNADAFIMDCEGCEEKLDFSQLNKYNIVLIAVHEWSKNKTQLLRHMYGWVLQFVSDDSKEIMLRKG